MDKRKILRKLLSGSKNIRFSEVQKVAEAFGFQLDRISGSHQIYVHPDIPALLNLQNMNGQAKPYQIRQLLKLVEKYSLTLGDD